MDADLELALGLADAADSLTLPRFRASDLRVETKPDMSPVTEADKAAEQAMRTLLAKSRGGDAILGEEFGSRGSASRRWVLDPIDATKNYVRGVPVWGTLIALEEGGEVRVGVVSAPALGRRWWAVRGAGAFANGAPIHVSTVRRIEDAHVLHGGFDGGDPTRWGELLVEIGRQCWRMRGFGDFWQHMLVAEGAAEAALDPVVNEWDLAAVQVIVEEAGGRFSDFGGARRLDGGTGLSSNGSLHEAIAAVLGRDLD